MPIFTIRYKCKAYAEIAIRCDTEEQALDISEKRADSDFTIYARDDSFWELDEVQELGE